MKHQNVIGGALLVAGTSIGAGMLALPVQTGLGGFIPAIFIYFVCWLFMTATGLLLLEICLKMSPDVNLVSMASHYFGKTGQVVAWVLYLFLFYCLSIAYISAGGGFLHDWLGLSGQWSGPLLFVSLLAPFVYFGAKLVDRLNIFLMIGLIGTYLLFVFFALPYVNMKLLYESNYGPAILALPIVFTSFSYQGLIPSLTTYMKRDAEKIRLAIILGTSLTFAIYVFWEFLILGIVPLNVLKHALEHEHTAVQPLRQCVTGPIVAAGNAFAFLAITTSYLGVTLGLFDFLADGFRLAKKGGQRVFLASLTFLPPLLVALFNSGMFLTALGYAGGIGCAILLGALPTLMVWKARSKQELGPQMLPGGKFVLTALLFFVILEVSMELLLELGKKFTISL